MLPSNWAKAALHVGVQDWIDQHFAMRWRAVVILQEMKDLDACGCHFFNVQRISLLPPNT